MKIDLHVHSSERSACGKSPEEAQIRAAIKAGLDALVFTDHHKLVPLERLHELNTMFAPFKIFGGIEITSDGEDWLVVGLRDGALESSEWHYPDLHTFVRKHNGFIALAHPFRYRDHIGVDIERFRPDAIEVRSPNTPARFEARIRELALRLRLHTLHDSDAHTADPIGKYYNMLEGEPINEQVLVAMLKNGQLTNNAIKMGSQPSFFGIRLWQSS
jgi:predicted metal-dependent phosphoesterase TrpH